MSCPPETDGKAHDAGCFLRYLIIGATVRGGGGILLIVFTAFSRHRRSRKPKADPRANLSGASQLQGPIPYSYKDLESATNSFSEENKLGERGFGDVFKGNRNIVAVKRMALASSRAKFDFEIEVKLISNVHHRNLLRLLGCSHKGPELLLVYDYMANGSLDKFLYCERRGTLNWTQRFDIIFGTARGLAYLHEQFHFCIIHRDTKSSNILLDDHFQPKIADFGRARLLPGDRSHLSTKFAGTFLGVVVLEIDDLTLKLVDENLDPNECQAEEVKKVIEIALMRIQLPASARLTMSEVVVFLASEGVVAIGRPTRPTSIDKKRKSTGSSTSNATASVTDFTGR
ncbi:Non-specific serine/threonine protein kinase [Bertholletia excelsa]